MEKARVATDLYHVQRFAPTRLDGKDGGAGRRRHHSVTSRARQMTAGEAIDDATFSELQAALGAEHLTDLVVTIAFYCGVVRLLTTFGIDVEPEYLHYLEEFPLPAR
jgi:hypothetical protein